MVAVKANRSGIKKAVVILRRGGVIVYPTDTAYGLGGVFDSPAVVKKILRIKNRRDRKFTVVAASQLQVGRFFKLDPLQKKLAKCYWPGPLSIVVSKQFAVRVPKNKIARALCRRVGKPLIASSANRTGGPTPYSARSVVAQFARKKKQPDLLVDGGRLKRQKTSTVVQVVGNSIKMLRPGAIDISD